LVSKRQIKRLKDKLQPEKEIELPKIYLRNEKGQLINSKTGQIISEKEIEENNGSDYPDIILTRGKEGGSSNGK